MVGKYPVSSSLTTVLKAVCRPMGGHEGVVDSSKHVPAGPSKSPILRCIMFCLASVAQPLLGLGGNKH